MVRYKESEENIRISSKLNETLLTAQSKCNLFGMTPPFLSGFRVRPQIHFFRRENEMGNSRIHSLQHRRRPHLGAHLGATNTQPTTSPAPGGKQIRYTRTRSAALAKFAAMTFVLVDHEDSSSFGDGDSVVDLPLITSVGRATATD